MIVHRSRSLGPLVCRWSAVGVAVWGLAIAGAAAASPAPVAPEPGPVLPDAGRPNPAVGKPTGDRASVDVPLRLPVDESPAAGPSAARTPVRPLGDWTVLVSIAAAFAILAAFRMRSLRRTRPLPPDVFELLGEAPLGGQHAVRVVRFGPRTLLLAVSAAGCRTLATLEDPEMTERVVAACQGERSPARRPPVPRAGPPVRAAAVDGEAA